MLLRKKSVDLKNAKKAQALKEQQERQRQARPPKLPEFTNNAGQLSTSLSQELQQSDSGYSISSYSLSASGSGGLYTQATAQPRSYATNASPPVPPIPDGGFDPYARTESMTHRGRHSYASSAVSTINSPRRVRRRRDPTPFNILVIGTRGAGKTSFLEFLKTALALPRKRRTKHGEDEFQMSQPASGNFVPHFMETEVEKERVGLTLWDSEGLEKNLVDLQLRELSAFIESKFEETFTEEMRVIRSPGVQDTHIHAVFLVLDPSRLDRNIEVARKNAKANGYVHENHQITAGALDEEMDLSILRTLHHKTTVIPVIAKADTITTKHMNILKKSVWECIKNAGLDPIEALGLEDDSANDRIDEEAEEDEEKGPQPEAEKESDVAPDELTGSPGSKRLSSQSIRRHKAHEESKEDDVPFLPLSIISPDQYEPSIVGRQFPWGFADPYNNQHCDFQRLKEAVFAEWRADLREASREQWYEGWRTNRLKVRSMPYRRA